MNTAALAICLIIAGIMILGHNLGWIGDCIYNVVVSWPMILIVLGVVAFLKRNWLSGFILSAIGIYFLLFLLPRIGGIDAEQIWIFWPVFLILTGLLILLKRNHKHVFGGPCRDENGAFLTGKNDIVDGFVTVNISFGNVRQTVLDPVFKGGNIDVSFGSMFLDLRRTSLEAPETILHVNLLFGGMELTVPSQWNVVIETATTLGGCEDKRFLAHEIDNEHKLVIRGNVTCSGLQIKS
ncbi:MAG: wall-active antibiotics response protein [Bacteroidales bacterium]